jgi:hypothetical protein
MSTRRRKPAAVTDSERRIPGAEAADSGAGARPESASCPDGTNVARTRERGGGAERVGKSPEKLEFHTTLPAVTSRSSSAGQSHTSESQRSAIDPVLTRTGGAAGRRSRGDFRLESCMQVLEYRVAAGMALFEAEALSPPWRRVICARWHETARPRRAGRAAQTERPGHKTWRAGIRCLELELWNP